MSNYATFKRYVIFFVLALNAYLLFHFLTWKFFTEKILSGKNYGDLARMAYRPDLKKVRDDYVDLPMRHSHIGKIGAGKVDVLTVGDSFSNGCGGGRNSFYQDYIATIYGKKVVNVSMLGASTVNLSDPVQILLVLINGGVIDAIKPRVVLLETSERLVYQRLAKELDMHVTLPREQIERFYRAAADVKYFYLPKQSFINDGNLKFYYYAAKRWFERDTSVLKLQKKLATGYFINDPAKRLTSEVVGQLKLSKPLFSGKNGDTLLFTIDELIELPKNQQEKADLINSNLNSIEKVLENKNTRLYFMMIPDKTNLYSRYITQVSFPESRLFELLGSMKKDYTFIDGKKALRKELDYGNPIDLFHADDTHWTCRASELVVKSVDFK